VQTLGGVKQYVDGYLKSQKARAAAKAAAAASRAEEREAQARIDYDRFRRLELEAIFKSLPLEEQASIESLARSTALPTGRKEGFLTQTFFEMDRARIIAERFSSQLRVDRQNHVREPSQQTKGPAGAGPSDDRKA
jgi:hypothetical protein